MSDDENAVGPDGSLVTMVRACLSMIDENQKIKEECDQYFVSADQ